MDVKTPVEEEAYAKATVFHGDAEILVSKILSSLAFLEAEKKKQTAGTFVELRTTIVPGLNDSAEAIEKICGVCKSADLYALQQFSSGAKGTFVDKHFELPAEQVPSKEKMYEFAYCAKKTFKEVLIRFNDGSEELI